MAERAHSTLLTNLFIAVVVIVVTSWLGGSTCVSVYCHEDCDPCLQQCKCSGDCQHSHATFAATHALEGFEIVEHAGERGVPQRTFTEILGLSVERAGGAAWPSDDDLVRFVRGVIDVNSAQLARPDADQVFALDSVSRFETAIVVQIHQVAAPDGGNHLSFLFDPRGNLIEIDQVLSAPSGK